jgi:hypothetical protein
MRRGILAMVLAMLFLVVLIPPGMASSGEVEGPTPGQLNRRYLNFLFTKADSPYVAGGCGKVRHGVYMSPIALGPDGSIACTVRAGVPILVSPAFAFFEIPTFGSNDAEILAEAKAGFAGSSGSLVRVDGERVSLKGTLSTRVFDVGPVEEGSAYDFFCEGLPDPCQKDFVPGDIVRIASKGYFVLIEGLTPGRHTVVLRTTFEGIGRFKITIHLTVRRGYGS